VVKLLRWQQSDDRKQLFRQPVTYESEVLHQSHKVIGQTSACSSLSCINVTHESQRFSWIMKTCRSLKNPETTYCCSMFLNLPQLLKPSWQKIFNLLNDKNVELLFKASTDEKSLKFLTFEHLQFSDNWGHSICWWRQCDAIKSSRTATVLMGPCSQNILRLKVAKKLHFFIN